ncbi:MAG: preprotein translocase subunit YajC [Cellvibrionales bacterium]|nr:MAG: preprotein translocase subunit YajC [Cellvibrionales bacterium]
MSFFISSALAAPAAPGEPNPLITVVMFGGLFLFMYLMIIRPQRKRSKEHKSLVENLSKGDEVVTNSGILGKIAKMEGEYLILDVSDTVELKFQRAAIHAVLPKGTIKAI